jgi:hypothetical protein
MQDYNPDNDPWRRGIYRSSAQRLSLSLAAPLMAQRSLLFRIKADLADTGKEVETYREVSIAVNDLYMHKSTYSITS